MKAGERFLVVRLAGQEFAIPSNRICGMVQTRGMELRQVAGCGALRYWTKLHGRSMPVYAPHRALGLADRQITARSCLLLIRERPTAAEAEYALAVDSVSRLEVLPPASVRADTGQVRLGDKWKLVLDLDTVRVA
ncbi:MAG: chemotaxis protein CheW [Paludibaculum sp.]